MTLMQSLLCVPFAMGKKSLNNENNIRKPWLALCWNDQAVSGQLPFIEVGDFVHP